MRDTGVAKIDEFSQMMLTLFNMHRAYCIVQYVCSGSSVTGMVGGLLFSLSYANLRAGSGAFHKSLRMKESSENCFIISAFSPVRHHRR